MSTSRKLRVKLAKHRRSARKAAQKNRSRTHREFHGRDTGLHGEGNSHCPLCAHRVSICLLLPLAVGPKIICRTQFVHLHISEPTSGTQRQTTPGTLRAASLGHRNAPRKPPQQVGSVKNLAVCLSHFPSEIWPNTHFVFIPQLAAPGKGSAKPPPLTLTARRRPHQTATPQAPSTLRLRRARTRKISSSRTTPQTS